MRPEDNPEKVKLREQKAFKEGEIKEDELQCVHYCSWCFQMYSTFALSTRDAYGVFLAPQTPYPRAILPVRFPSHRCPYPHLLVSRNHLST